MNIYYQSKFEYVKSILPNKEIKLLDLGCRDNILKNYIHDKVDYIGMDLFQNAENGVNIVSNIEEGILVQDESIDIITALDIFEHLNDMQKSILESIRKLKRGGKLIIQLPNLSFMPFRLDYFFNGRFTSTNKYLLKYNYGLDRHRWITVIVESDQFMKDMCLDKNLTYSKVSMVSLKLKAFIPILKLLRLKDSFYASSVIHVIEKN